MAYDNKSQYYQYPPQQQYAPPAAGGQYPPSGGGGGGGGAGSGGGQKGPIRTLWVGDLDAWIDELYLYNMFASAGHAPVSAVILNRASRDAEALNFGFVEFPSHDVAVSVMQQLHGTKVPNNAPRVFRLKLAQSDTHRGSSRAATAETAAAAAAQGNTGAQPPNGGGNAAAATNNAPAAATPAPRGLINEWALFVGDLAPTVTDAILECHFKLKFGSVCGAKVVNAAQTARGASQSSGDKSTKLYGFVRFNNEAESLQALSQFNNTWLMSKMMRIKIAIAKPQSQLPSSLPASMTTAVLQQMSSQGALDYQNDPDNFAILIGTLMEQEHHVRAASKRQSMYVQPNMMAGGMGMGMGMAPYPAPGMMMPPPQQMPYGQMPYGPAPGMAPGGMDQAQQHAMWQQQMMWQQYYGGGGGGQAPAPGGSGYPPQMQAYGHGGWPMQPQTALPSATAVPSSAPSNNGYSAGSGGHSYPSHAPAASHSQSQSQSQSHPPSTGAAAAPSTAPSTNSSSAASSGSSEKTESTAVATASSAAPGQATAAAPASTPAPASTESNSTHGIKRVRDDSAPDSASTAAPSAAASEPAPAKGAAVAAKSSESDASTAADSDRVEEPKLKKQHK